MIDHPLLCYWDEHSINVGQAWKIMVPLLFPASTLSGQMEAQSPAAGQFMVLQTNVFS